MSFVIGRPNNFSVEQAETHCPHSFVCVRSGSHILRFARTHDRIIWREPADRKRGHDNSHRSADRFDTSGSADSHPAALAQTAGRCFSGRCSLGLPILLDGACPTDAMGDRRGNGLPPISCSRPSMGDFARLGCGSHSWNGRLPRVDPCSPFLDCLRRHQSPQKVGLEQGRQSLSTSDCSRRPLPYPRGQAL
jgi:hypothetical protein